MLLLKNSIKKGKFRLRIYKILDFNLKAVTRDKMGQGFEIWKNNIKQNVATKQGCENGEDIGEFLSKLYHENNCISY